MQCVRPMPFKAAKSPQLVHRCHWECGTSSVLDTRIGDSLISSMSTLGTDVQAQGTSKQGAKRKRGPSDTPPSDAGEDEGHGKLSRSSPAPRRRPIKRKSLVGDIAIHVAGTEEVDAELRNAVSYLGSCSCLNSHRLPRH